MYRFYWLQEFKENLFSVLLKKIQKDNFRLGTASLSDPNCKKKIRIFYFTKKINYSKPRKISKTKVAYVWSSKILKKFSYEKTLAFLLKYN